MNFLETFEELNKLCEDSDGGQRTYKQFLIFLLKFLGGKDYGDYENWVLHHVNGDHNKNDSFENLVLMHPTSHHILHGTVQDKKEYDYAERLRAEMESSAVSKTKKYEYISIGKEIEDELKKLLEKTTEEAE